MLCGGYVHFHLQTRFIEQFLKGELGELLLRAAQKLREARGAQVAEFPTDPHLRACLWEDILSVRRELQTSDCCNNEAPKSGVGR